jgi:hypothetical protein
MATELVEVLQYSFYIDEVKQKELLYVCNMRTVFKITTIALSIPGIFALLLLTRNLLEKNKLESAYLKNCKLVQAGMTMQTAESLMRQGLDIQYRGFDYEVETNADTIQFITMNYPVDGGSFIIKVKIDKNTGLVESVNCPKTE